MIELSIIVIAISCLVILWGLISSYYFDRVLYKYKHRKISYKTDHMCYECKFGTHDNRNNEYYCSISTHYSTKNNTWDKKISCPLLDGPIIIEIDPTQVEHVKDIML